METFKTGRDTASENVMPRYVKSHINEQVKLLLAEVHALRLGLMNNTNFSLVKSPPLFQDVYVILLRGLFSVINSTYVGDRGRLGRMSAFGNASHICCRFDVVLLYWVALAEVYILQAHSCGITLRDEMLWFYGSDNVGQRHRCPFRFYGDLTSQNANGLLNVTFFYYLSL